MRASLSKGDLDRRVTIKRPTEGAADGFNNKTVTLVTYGEFYASKKDVSDGEKFRSQQTVATIDTRFTVRWSPEAQGILDTDVLIFNGRQYGILGRKEIGRQDYIEISCKARAETALP